MNHNNKRKEKQEKLHDSLINMLYAPPSPPSPHTQFDHQTLTFAREIVHSDNHQINTEEFEEENKRGECELESSENEEDGFQKLTRAQRKRLRKKKLKEAGLHRRPIIGPELPGGDQLDGDQYPEGVRGNASEKPESGNDRDRGGHKPSCIKVKHRRMTKKKATDKPTTSHEATSHGDQD